MAPFLMRRPRWVRCASRRRSRRRGAAIWTPPDAARIMAAKTLIAYQKAKARAPVASLAPEKLRLKTDRDIEESAAAEYAAKVAKILKKYGRLK